MQIILFSVLFASLFVGSELHAACVSEKWVNPDQVYLGCKIHIQTPEFELSLVKGGGILDQERCDLYCSRQTAFPLSRRGIVRVIEMPLTAIQAWAEFMEHIGASGSPEGFLMRVLMASMNGVDEDSVHMEELWDQHVQSEIHQRDSDKILKEDSYKLLKNSDVQVEELKGLQCSICLDSIEKQFEDHQEIVRVNCGSSQGGHIFCKSCIQESYQFQQNCPVCRGEIKSFAHVNP